MESSADHVANEMRSTLARLHSRAAAAKATHGRIIDAAHERSAVVDEGMPALKAGAVNSPEGVEAYAAHLNERATLHRLAALPR